MSTLSRRTVSGLDDELDSFLNRELGALLALGIATGILIGFVTAIVPVVGFVVTGMLGILLVRALGAGERSRGIGLASTLAGVGLVLAAAANTAIQCSATDDFCGDTNIAPALAAAYRRVA